MRAADGPLSFVRRTKKEGCVRRAPDMPTKLTHKPEASSGVSVADVKIAGRCAGSMTTCAKGENIPI